MKNEFKYITLKPVVGHQILNPVGFTCSRFVNVRNFPSNLAQKDIYSLVLAVFCEIGEIESVEVVTEPNGEEYRAEVCFKEARAARNAIDKYRNNLMHFGSPNGPLKVELNKNKKDQGKDVSALDPKAKPFVKSEKAAKKAVKEIRENLSEFCEMDIEKQRDTLGELLFPLVIQVAGERLAPKVTGMLLDFSVFSVTEILDLILNPDPIIRMVYEAVELIVP